MRLQITESCFESLAGKRQSFMGSEGGSENSKDILRTAARHASPSAAATSAFGACTLDSAATAT
jgi:hypothetical protein